MPGVVERAGVGVVELAGVDVDVAVGRGVHEVARRERRRALVLAPGVPLGPGVGVDAVELLQEVRPTPSGRPSGSRRTPAGCRRRGPRAGCTTRSGRTPRRRSSVPGRTTTLSSTITSGRCSAMICRSRGSAYRAPSTSAAYVGWTKVASWSRVGLANSGAVSLTKSIQNWPAAPSSASGSGSARSTSASTKPYGSSRPAHDASAANTTRCPRSSSTLPRPMHWLVGP